MSSTRSFAGTKTRRWRRLLGGTVLGSVGLGLIAASTSCGAPGPRVAMQKRVTGKGVWKPEFPHSRVFPDVTAADGSVVLESHGAASSVDVGEQNRIYGRMRLTLGQKGVIKRASDLLPAGRVWASELPARLGGGYIIAVINGRGTEIYRADTWLAKLKPLTATTNVADGEGPIVIGFDRLYIRLKSTNELIAVDAQTGKLMPLGPLPIAPSYGDMVFVDGWRAVIETDLRGVMATFDAGATWRHVPVRDHVRSITESLGDPLITVDNGSYRLSERGILSFVTADPRATADVRNQDLSLLSQSVDEAKKPHVSPLGKRPLRSVLEDGYPESGKVGVVAKNGSLGRVSLEDGSILEEKENAFPETASCHGIKLGPKFGFVCGEPSGRTSLYEFIAPLDANLVAEFDDPRIVTESGQGNVIISGSCGKKNEAPPPAKNPDPKKPESKSFCVRTFDGVMREIRVRGDLGAERIVALGDGRVVVLVPPRPGSMGQISIIDRSSAKHVSIKVPDDAPVRELESGMWLEGFQESGKDEIGGWVEAGGPMLGVRIKLDGTLTAGQLVEEDNGVLTSGPFALAVGTRGRALETLDGGLTWKDIVMPAVDTGQKHDDRVRRCSVIGCALPGLLRVGWGEPEVKDDLAEAIDPEPLKVPTSKLISPTLRVACGAPLESHAVAKAPPAKKPVVPGAANQTPGGWLPFRGVDPPVLGKDEDGIDNGAAFDVTPLRAYAWGKKDSDWTRTGRYKILFSDRFSVDEVRSSAPTQAPWQSESVASDLLGLGAYGYSVSWGAAEEPSGKAALVSACRGRACTVFAVESDRPVLPFRSQNPNEQVDRPINGSAVRIGEAWFYLAEGTSSDRMELHRTELGTVKSVRDIPRPHQPRYSSVGAPRLVRRATGAGLGLYFTAKTSFLDKKGERYVVPIDLDSGSLGDPIDLGPNDASGLKLSTCDQNDRDGWLVITTASDPLAEVKVDGVSYGVDSFELRTRLDPGFACIEAASGTVNLDPPGATAKGGTKTDVQNPFSLVVRQVSSGKHTGLRCKIDAK